MENAKNMEIFKDIKGYPDYQISNRGRVWSAKSNSYLKPCKNNKGYYLTHLIAKNGKRKTELIHRLVALTFIDNPNGYPEVNHKDRNKDNNTVENLEWCTRSQNNRNTSQNRILEVYKDNILVFEGCLTACAEFIGCARSSIYTYFSRKTKTLKGYTIANKK